MKKTFFLRTFLYSVLFLGLTHCFAPLTQCEEFSSRDILDKVDKMWRGESSIGTYEMNIKTAHWQRSLRVKSWTRGLDYTLIRIEYPKKEKGVATLKVQNNLWNYLPKINRVIKVPSSLMMGSWMGSHFTNDDLVKESTLADDYTHSITFQGQRDGEEVYEITLIPREEAAVVWGKIVILIRKNDLMPLHEEFFDEDGKAVRKMLFTDIKTMGGRLLPGIMKIVPYDKPGEFTEVIYLDIAFDTELPETFFSLRNLQR
jgi:hypothetical protein